LILAIDSMISEVARMFEWSDEAQFASLGSCALHLPGD